MTLENFAAKAMAESGRKVAGMLETMRRVVADVERQGEYAPGLLERARGIVEEFGAPESFVRQYVETMLWSSTDESTPCGGEPMDSNYDETDLADETRTRVQKDCDAFWHAACKLIADADATGEVRETGDGEGATELAGHDFWLTRCGHGAGFWDGDWPEPYGDALSEVARQFGNLDPYVGDDCKIYMM